MSSPNDILSLYEAVADISQQMLDAARRKDWKDFNQLELLCKGYVQQIPVHNDKTPLTAEGLQRKVACLKKIFSNDKEIMDLLQPWMARLSDLLDGNEE